MVRLVRIRVLGLATTRGAPRTSNANASIAASAQVTPQADVRRSMSFVVLPPPCADDPEVLAGHGNFAGRRVHHPRKSTRLRCGIAPAPARLSTAATSGARVTSPRPGCPRPERKGMLFKSRTSGVGRGAGWPSCPHGQDQKQDRDPKARLVRHAERAGRRLQERLELHLELHRLRRETRRHLARWDSKS